MKIDWIEPEVLAASDVPFRQQNLYSLHQQGIQAIVSLTEHPLTVFESITPELFTELEISYYHSPIPDQYPPTMSQAQEILDFLDQMKAQRRATLIHCHAGIGRTGTLLHVYYLAQGLSLEQATQEVKSRRPQCTLLSDNQWAFLKKFVAQKSV